MWFWHPGKHAGLVGLAFSIFMALLFVALVTWPANSELLRIDTSMSDCVSLDSLSINWSEEGMGKVVVSVTERKGRDGKLSGITVRDGDGRRIWSGAATSYQPAGIACTRADGSQVIVTPDIVVILPARDK